MKMKIALILFGTILFLSACNNNQIETNMSEVIPEFEYTTQNDEPLGLEDLRGDWWIAYFSYTHCQTVCPRTTANMISIQEELKKADINPRIISFSIDPANDTPEVLKEYGKEFGADLNTFSFLTGYEFETIQDLSVNTFQSVLQEGAMDQRSHSFYFYLINPKGEIVKKYDGMSQRENDLLVEDVKVVLGKS